jgi:uncharacterized protein (TIGR03435 family)
VRTSDREVLALGLFDRGSRVRERIEMLLARGREFSPRASMARVGLSVVALLGLVGAGSLAPRWIALAQTRPAFEVASVRSHVFTGGRGGGAGPGGGNATRVSRTPERITLQAMSTGEIITFAYGFPAGRIEGRPEWLYQDSYDVIATTSSPADLPEQKVMLQKLLEDRFGLAVHKVSKEGPIYALVPGKKPNLAAAQESSDSEVVRFKPLLVRRPDGAMDMVWTGNPASTADLTAWLSGMLDRPVLDKTGMQGFFDIKVSTPRLEVGESFGPAQFISAVREQLGLNLESTKGLVDFLVIDHVQKPGEN